MNQQNRTALVTGASRGLDARQQRRFARAGAHVLVHYGRSAREGKSFVSEIQTEGGLANAISTDLGTPDVGLGSLPGGEPDAMDEIGCWRGNPNT